MSDPARPPRADAAGWPVLPRPGWLPAFLTLVLLAQVLAPAPTAGARTCADPVATQVSAPAPDRAPAQAGSPPQDGAQAMHARMLDRAVEFTGVESDPMRPGEVDELRIGLFIGTGDPVSEAIRRGTELAITRANAAGGVNGTPLRLLIRSADDLWGTGARELTRLVFEDRARLVIGGHDGASSHVAQQITTKAHLPLIVPVSSDPSLTHARVPWIFRLAPDDRAQAEALIEGGLRPRGLERVTLITSTDHDGRVAATELTAALERAGLAPIAHLSIDPDHIEPGAILDRLSGFRPDSVILRLPPDAVRDLLREADERDLPLTILIPWIPGLDPRQLRARLDASPTTAGNAALEVVLLEPFHRPAHCGPYLKLARHYIRAYGEYPPPAAAYAYDAANLAITALKSGRLDRSAIRDRLAAASGTTMATGVLAWDNGGGNLGHPEVLARASD